MACSEKSGPPKLKMHSKPRIQNPPPPNLPSPHTLSPECARYGNVFVDVDVVEVKVIMGAGMDSLVVDVVEINVIMGTGMHSLVSCFAVNNSNLAVVEVFVQML